MIASMLYAVSPGCHMPALDLAPGRVTRCIDTGRCVLLSRVLGWLLAASMVLLSVTAAAAADPDKKAEYVLGPGDVVRISVFQNPDLTVETRVSETGSITYPLVGTVAVGGLAIPEAEQRIGQRLREGGFVLQPQVNLLLLQIRGNQIAVLGQVNRPGRYPLETFDTRLSDMLATAGGIAATGADTAILTGVREGKRVRQEIDIPSLFLKSGTGGDIPLVGGDIIYVHRAPMFYIYGEVQRAGVYRLERDMTVMQGLASGGGLTPRGTERGIRVHRRDAEGKLEVLETRMDDPLKADDVIYVKESLF